MPLENAKIIEGTVCSSPSKFSSGKFYAVKLKLFSVQGKISGVEVKSRASGKISVLVPAEIVEALFPGRLYSASGGGIFIERGERLSFSGKFKAPFFSAEKALQQPLPPSFSGRIIRLRTLCRLSFKKLMYGWGSAGGFILALLSGSREYLDPALQEIFRKAGLSHVLALSGMHLSFFSLIAGKTGSRIFGRKYDFFFRAAGILFFVWFAGLSPSLLRALLCSALLLLCGIFFCARISFFKILCAVFLIHCMLFPEDIFSAAFMLSYSALAGILVFGGLFRFFMQRFLPRRLTDLASASAGAQAATFPICISLFKAVPAAGIAASVAVCPLVSIFLAAAIVAIIVSFMIPFLSPLMGAMLNFLYQLIKSAAAVFSLFPMLAVD
ncbi:ComEC/Rec2 family competence protein [Treponema sp.]|uniref:ComEC/Rec2 family competence protein n=1 Tax=Treponema sp. TaxID=166 RepID=UPI003EFFFDD1